MKGIFDLVLQEYTDLIKKSGGKPYVNNEDIEQLPLNQSEKGILRMAFEYGDIPIVSTKESIVTEENNNLEQSNTKLAVTIEYDGEEIDFESYDQLDEFIDEIFLPNEMKMMISSLSNGEPSNSNKPFPSIQLRKIMGLNLREEVLEHVLQKLDSEGLYIDNGLSNLDNNRDYDYTAPYKDLVLKYIEKYCEPLPWNEMKEKFIQYYETRDPELREELILRNIRIVPYITWSIAKNSDVDREELDGYGYEGLIEAVDKYNPMLGMYFSAHANRIIKQRVKTGIKSMKDTSFNKSDNNYFLIQEMKKILEDATGKTIAEDPTMIEDIINILVKEERIPMEKADYYKELLQQDNMVSLEEETEKNGEPIDSKFNIETEAFPGLIKDEVNELMTILTPKEKDVLTRYFGLEDKPETLDEIGRTYGVQRQRIREIKAKAFRKMIYKVYRTKNKYPYADAISQEHKARMRAERERRMMEAQENKGVSK